MSEPTLGRRTLLRGSAGALGGVALGPAVAGGASAGLSLDLAMVGEMPTGPGDEVTFAATVTNETDRALRVVLAYHYASAQCCYYAGDCSPVSAPPPIPVENAVSHSDAGASYQPVSWAWDEIPAGGQRRVTVTFRLPDDLPDGADELRFGAAAPALCDVSGVSPFAMRTVQVPTGGQSLSADFSHSPSTPNVGESVSLDASPSTPRSAPIETFEWDVGADGSVDATGETATVTFEESGERTVELQVTEKITRTVEWNGEERTITATITDSASKAITVRDPTALEAAPTSLDFGTTVAGTAQSTDLTVSNPTDGSIHVDALDAPTGLSAEANCEVNLWFIRYGCEPTPPLDVPAGGEKTLSLSYAAPMAGAVNSVDAEATVRTGDGDLAVPVTATVLADADTLRSFESAAARFALFLDASAGAEAVGDELVGMYGDVMKAVGHRIGKQYVDALKDVQSAGKKLREAGEDLNTRQFVKNWEASVRGVDAQPQPGELQEGFQRVEAALAKCRRRVEDGRLEAAADAGRTAESRAKAVVGQVETAYRAMDRSSADTYFSDFVTSARAYADAVTGGRAYDLSLSTQ